MSLPGALIRPPYFNPRSPCGERPNQARKEATKTLFQSTLPVWGATRNFRTNFAFSLFQSTLPVWGATEYKQAAEDGVVISIHAPRVGSDCPGWGFI